MITLLLEGLTCSHCASKIEEAIMKLNNVNSVSLDFTNQRIFISPKGNNNLQIIDDVKAIVKKIEPHVNVAEHESAISHSEEKGNSMFKSIIKKYRTEIIGSLFFLGAIITQQSTIKLVLYIIAYILIGKEVILSAFKNILKGEVFDENFLMTIATFGAFALGEFSEAVAVMLFYQIGEGFQGYAVDNSRRSIKSLLDIKPDYANLLENESISKVNPESVSIGSTIIVKPGERVPLDGTVLSGSSLLDTSALTGESVPRKVSKGDEVLSGFINTEGVLTIKVGKEFGESTVSKILNLVEHAGAKKSPTERFITRFARYYTPIVVFSAVGLALLPPLLFKDATFSVWFERALIFLVVSCPCALVVSIPLGFFGGIGAASKKGILVKGGNYLEALNKVDTLVFDKTGTLTKGVFNVIEISPYNDRTEEDLIMYAAIAESMSNHPIAKSILNKYNSTIDDKEIKDYKEISGLGVSVVYKGNTIFAGNNKLMEENNITYVTPKATGTTVHVAHDNKYLGYILIADELKNNVEKLIPSLKKFNIKKFILLTGDRKEVGESIGNSLGFDVVKSELLPSDKVKEFEKIKNNNTNSKIAFVGDGINDAPALAIADVGIAMGALGSDAAIEAADIVLMTDEPHKITEGISISRFTNKIVWQNIIFALGIKIIVMALGAIGFATMWMAIFADVGVALLAILNATRVLKV